MAQSTETPESGIATSEPASKPVHAGEEDFRRPSRTHSKGFRIGLAIAILVLIVVGFFVYRYLTGYESTDDAQIDGHINSVSARISGHVLKLDVADNQYVGAGQVLIEIDPADYQVAYNRAKADFDEAEAAAEAAGVTVPITSVNTTSQVSSTLADVNSARAGIQAAKQQYEAAEAELRAAEANSTKAQQDLERYKLLVAKQEISQQEYDQAYAAAAANAATVQGAKASAQAAQQQVTQAEGRLVQAEANYRYASTAPRQMRVTRAHADEALAVAQQRKAALDQAALNLEYTKVRAPIDGIVSNRTVEVGQNVSPGQQMMNVINLTDIWITANFKETQLAEMRVNQPVTIHVDANGRSYNGKVNSIAGASGARFSLLPPENATGNYVKVVQRIPVKIVLDPDQNKDHALRPGMSVEPKVWLRQ